MIVIIIFEHLINHIHATLSFKEERQPQLFQQMPEKDGCLRSPDKAFQQP